MEIILVWIFVSILCLQFQDKKRSLHLLLFWNIKSLFVIFFLQYYYKYYAILDLKGYLTFAKEILPQGDFFSIGSLLKDTFLMGADGTFTIKIVVGFFYYIFPSEEAIEFLFSAFSLIGYIYLIKLIDIRLTKSYLLLFYFPSTFFWFSTISKEVIIFVAISGYIYHVHQLFTANIFKIRNLFLSIMWLQIAYAIRSWIPPIVIISTFCWILFRWFFSNSIKQKIFSSFLLMLFFLTILVQYDFFNNRVGDIFHGAEKFAVGHSSTIPLVYSGLIDYIISFPILSIKVLLEPFISQINYSSGYVYDLAIISNLLLCFVLIMLFVMIFIYKRKNHYNSECFSTDVSLFLFFTTICYLFFYLPYLHANLGTGFRFKSIITSFIISMVIWKIEKVTCSEKILRYQC